MCGEVFRMLYGQVFLGRRLSLTCHPEPGDGEGPHTRSEGAKKGFAGSTTSIHLTAKRAKLASPAIVRSLAVYAARDDDNGRPGKSAIQQTGTPR